jgi:hypothetical protein
MNKRMEIKPKSPKGSNLTQINTRTACQPPRGAEGIRREKQRELFSPKPACNRTQNRINLSEPQN